MVSRGAAVAILLGAAAGTLVAATLIGRRAAGAPPPPPPPPAANTAVVAAFNAGLVADLISGVGPYLLPGDVVDLVSGNSAGVADPADIAAWAAEIARALPRVRVSCHTSGLVNVRALLAAPLPANVYGVAYDYEPNFEPEFTFDWPTTLATHKTFAGYCHAAGKNAIGYPTGRAVLGDYGWNYGTLATVCDELWVQTEGNCFGGSNESAMSALESQFRGAGVSLSRLRNNATIGSSADGVTPAAGAACLQQAPTGAGWYLWPTEGQMAQVAETLQLLGRTAGG
ncbi:MAG: hypothetical protein ACREB9_00740 [Thermoplasmata archaeon]